MNYKKNDHRGVIILKDEYCKTGERRILN